MMTIVQKLKIQSNSQTQMSVIMFTCTQSWNKSRNPKKIQLIDYSIRCSLFYGLVISCHQYISSFWKLQQ